MIAEVNNTSTSIDLGYHIPKHWQFTRIKNLFREIDRRSESGKEDLLSVSQYTGVTLRKDAFEEGKEITNAKTLKGYKIVERGDLVSNIMLAWNGCLGISPYYGITSPAYCVYRVRDESQLNPEYFGYLFSTGLFKGEFRKRSTGIIESRLRLYTDSFFRIFSFVPPKDEQDKIVDFINSESSKITRFIQTKQRFVAQFNIVFYMVKVVIEFSPGCNIPNLSGFIFNPPKYDVIEKFITSSFISMSQRLDYINPIEIQIPNLKDHLQR